MNSNGECKPSSTKARNTTPKSIQSLLVTGKPRKEIRLAYTAVSDQNNLSFTSITDMFLSAMVQLENIHGKRWTTSECTRLGYTLKR